MNNRKELIELNKLYRKRLVDSVITKLLKVLEFTGLDIHLKILCLIIRV